MASPKVEMAKLTSLSSCVALLLALAAALAQAQTSGIYTCVDARGKRITSDRPIPECVDREQKLLNPSGSVKGRIGPTLTAQERADVEAKERLALEEKGRRDEEKRRDRALLLRYPSRVVHDNERAAAINQIGVVKAAAAKRVDELNSQRKTLNVELEFYKKDPSKVPPVMRRQLDELTQSQAVQARFIADQDNEVKRVDARFDEELVRLKDLWAKQQAGAVTLTAPQPKKATDPR